MNIMKTLPDNNPYKEKLMRILAILHHQIGLEKEDEILVVFQLNMEEKVIEFIEWIRQNLVNDKLQATPQEVMNKTSQISKKS